MTNVPYLKVWSKLLQQKGMEKDEDKTEKAGGGFHQAYGNCARRDPQGA